MCEFFSKLITLLKPKAYPTKEGYAFALCTFNKKPTFTKNILLIS